MLDLENTFDTIQHDINSHLGISENGFQQALYSIIVIQFKIATRKPPFCVSRIPSVAPKTQSRAQGYVRGAPYLFILAIAYII